MATVDPDLLDRLRRRDPAALREIAEAQTRPLYRAARGMGCDGPEAEDLVQDVFVTFLAGLDRFEGRSQLSTWLFGILHHKVQERRRANARPDDSIDDVFEAQFDARGHWISTPADPLRAAENQQVRAALAECLDALPVSQRATFHLRAVEELSAIEAGNVLGQSVTHVGVLLHRARARLRDCLQRKGFSGGR